MNLPLSGTCFKRTWLFSLFGFLAVLMIFRSGYLTSDSVTQLQEARDFIFNGWHPPIMAFVWRYLDMVLPGPIGMLVFHNLMFWTALAIIVQLLVPPNKKIVAVLMV